MNTHSKTKEERLIKGVIEVRTNIISSVGFIGNISKYHTATNATLIKRDWIITSPDLPSVISDVLAH
jgi:hypothetical protein